VDYRSRFWWTRKHVTYSGNVGTTPVQNIGAYGTEIKDTMVSCDTIAIQDQQLDFTNGDEAAHETQ
jgi:UDP-N-acetylenolpyruvoylglucosamine reductase